MDFVKIISNKKDQKLGEDQIKKNVGNAKLHTF